MVKVMTILEIATKKILRGRLSELFSYVDFYDSVTTRLRSTQSRQRNISRLRVVLLPLSGPCGHIGLPYSPWHKGVRRKLGSICSITVQMSILRRRMATLCCTWQHFLDWSNSCKYVTNVPRRQSTCAQQQESNGAEGRF